MCTRDDRVQFVNFFKDRAPKFLGGPRRFDQALERIDLCVAARDTQRPVATVKTTYRPGVSLRSSRTADVQPPK